MRRRKRRRSVLEESGGRKKKEHDNNNNDSSIPRTLLCKQCLEDKNIAEKMKLSGDYSSADFSCTRKRMPRSGYSSSACGDGSSRMLWNPKPPWNDKSENKDDIMTNNSECENVNNPVSGDDDDQEETSFFVGLMSKSTREEDGGFRGSVADGLPKQTTTNFSCPASDPHLPKTAESRLTPPPSTPAPPSEEEEDQQQHQRRHRRRRGRRKPQQQPFELGPGGVSFSSIFSFISTYFLASTLLFPAAGALKNEFREFTHHQSQFFFHSTFSMKMRDVNFLFSFL